MKIVCIIPARGGSKGVPRKNVRLLGDKPLIAHTIKTAIDSGVFEHVVVTTDDAEIANISKQYGAEVPFIRPAELSTDTISNDDVLIHAIKQLKSLGFNFDVSFLRDCTVPFIDQNDIKNSLSLFGTSDCDAVFGAVRAHPNPYFGMMEKNSSGYLKPSKSIGKLITQRQDAPIVYAVEGFFIHYVDVLLKTENINTPKIIPYEISKEHGHMIDFEIDFTIAEILLKQKSSLI
jgi:CMP-N-acetylneuraminic acid synthetase